jgi:hypothetical protein
MKITDKALELALSGDMENGKEIVARFKKDRDLIWKVGLYIIVFIFCLMITYMQSSVVFDAYGHFVSFTIYPIPLIFAMFVMYFGIRSFIDHVEYIKYLKSKGIKTIFGQS